jgi:gamma-glutamyl:cysteine ligase YbdK (ATP-grasp superfamily)
VPAPVAVQSSEHLDDRDAMGQEITAQHFQHRDFARFEAQLRAETDLLKHWIETGRFSSRRAIAGLELEAWLVDPRGHPAPANEAFLARLGMETVVPELAKFNIELNVSPQPIAGRGLERLELEMADTWRRCQETAATMGLDVISIGILPTVDEAHLCPANMSSMARYRALNEQVLRQRRGKPIRLSIHGEDSLATEHHDVMLEAGTTSLQAHLQVAPEEATRCYNASVLASAPMVALAANSPFLFGRALWQETRIPLFEQAVAVGSYEAAYRGDVPRVTFGTGYAGWSLAECFRENVDLFPVMLPLAFDEPAESLRHLRLHNGTIWRWNRPLIGFDDDATPHLRVEHRVMAAGPSILDMMANLACYYGFAAWLADQPTPPESILPFDVARANFYAAAQRGLDAEIVWLDAESMGLREFVLRQVIPKAYEGLARFGVDADLAARYLSVAEARARGGQTGAVWQGRVAGSAGRDLARLTLEYAAHQRTGSPVHTWEA